MNALLGVRITKRVVKEAVNIMEDRYWMDGYVANTTTTTTSSSSSSSSINP